MIAHNAKCVRNVTNSQQCFMLMYFPDDIPIQAGDESLNQSALLSISEETEASGEPQLGTRNNLVRSSKELLKTHKVPFSGFKKLKDKEKDKDSGGTNVANKNQLSKNGSILSMDGVKESVIVAATKQLTRKDKKNSLQMNSVDASDGNASPLLQIKRKSSNVEVTNNGPSLDLVQMQSFTNGNSIIVEEKKATDVIVDDAVSGIEKSADAVIGQQTQRTSLIVDQNGKTSTTNNNMQISQV